MCVNSLVKNHLDKDIVPSKSSYRVKKNRVTVTLWKADKNHSWLNLTEKNPGKSLRSDSSDPAAGIMDMMKVRAPATMLFTVGSDLRGRKRCSFVLLLLIRWLF